MFSRRVAPSLSSKNRRSADFGNVKKAKSELSTGRSRAHRGKYLPERNRKSRKFDFEEELPCLESSFEIPLSPRDHQPEIDNPSATQSNSHSGWSSSPPRKSSHLLQPQTSPIEHELSNREPTQPILFGALKRTSGRQSRSRSQNQTKRKKRKPVANGQRRKLSMATDLDVHASLHSDSWSEPSFCDSAHTSEKPSRRIASVVDQCISEMEQVVNNALVAQSQPESEDNDLFSSSCSSLSPLDDTLDSPRMTSPQEQWCGPTVPDKQDDSASADTKANSPPPKVQRLQNPDDLASQLSYQEQSKATAATGPDISTLGETSSQPSKDSTESEMTKTVNVPGPNAPNTEGNQPTRDFRPQPQPMDTRQCEISEVWGAFLSILFHAAQVKFKRMSLSSIWKNS